MSHSSLSPCNRFAQGEHGGDVQRIARLLGVRPGEILDFSSNSLVQARDITETIVAGADKAFDRYPDSESTALRKALARHESCTEEEILVGNGSAELIWLALAAVRPRRVALIGPAFSEYRRACEGLNIPYSVVTSPDGQMRWWPDSPALLPKGTDMLFLCSPNNPGGHTCPDLAGLIARMDGITVFADLAYRDFLRAGPLHDAHAWTTLQQAETNSRLICLHSMTKFFCCTGIRLGYLTAGAGLIAKMERARPSWMVSGFAENIGLELVRRFSAYRARLPLLYKDKDTLTLELRQSGLFIDVLDGPSFCLARVDTAHFPSPAALRAALIQRGILLRDCDGIPGMPPGWLRIQARGEIDTRALGHALRDCLRARDL